jgi:hypothetical protein
MASTLIIEDGTNVANANSYVTLTEFRAYALARGITLSLVDATDDAIMYKAMDYIETRLKEAQGMRAFVDQVLEWPRAEIDYYDTELGYVASTTYGIMINCMRVDIDFIPTQLKTIQMQVGLAIQAGVDFANYSEEQKFVIEEKVAVIQQKYSDKFGMSGNVSISSINNLFDVVLYACGNTGGLRTVRV